MATKTAAKTNSTDKAAFIERLQSRSSDVSMRRAITSFATAYLNNGSSIRRLGLELNVKDLVRCQWKHEVNEANAKLHGYKQGVAKRGNSSDDTIYFESFHAYVVDMSAKLIEFVGVKSENAAENKLQPLMLDGTLLNPYDRIGTIHNADGTKGTEYDVYNQLREEYPGCFTSRRFIMILLADEQGNTLHDIPVMMSIKGGALRYFDEAMINCQSRLGMVESSLLDIQDASPLSIKALRGYLLKFECTEGDSSNSSGQSSPVTAISNIGSNISAENAHEFFSVDKENMLTAWGVANPDFIAAYDAQVSQAIGTKIRASLEGAASEQFVLPEATATFSEVA